MLRQEVVRSVLILALSLALPAFVRAGVPGPPAAGDLLGSTGNVGASLIDIDPATGAGTFRFSLGSLGPVTEIEFRADGVLFGTTGGGASNVITIDPVTGAESLVGQHDFGAVNGLEFVGNTLYGSFSGAGPGSGQVLGSTYSLVVVDQTDGSLTIVGPLDGYAPIRGLAYDENTETMYGIGIPSATAGASGSAGLSDVLFTVDLATAAITEVGSTGFFLGALEFGPDGTLYGGDEGDGGGESGGGSSSGGSGWSSGTPRGGAGGGGATLVSIDLATGAATVVGGSGFPALSGLAFVPGLQGGGSPIVAIPALSPVGLVLLAALLAAVGLVAVRRGWIGAS